MKYGQCGKGTVASSRLTPDMLPCESLQITQKFFPNCGQGKKYALKQIKSALCPLTYPKKMTFYCLINYNSDIILRIIWFFFK